MEFVWLMCTCLCAFYVQVGSITSNLGATFGKYRIKLVSFEMEESLPEFPDQYHCIFLRVNETTQDFIFNGPVRCNFFVTF